MNLMRLNERIHRVSQVVIVVFCLVVGLAVAFSRDDFWTGVLAFLFLLAFAVLYVVASEFGQRRSHRKFEKTLRLMDAHPEEMEKLEKNRLLGPLIRLVRKRD